MLEAGLTKRESLRAFVKEMNGGWRLQLGKGDHNAYRLAQLDNYTHHSRRAFPHRPPLQIQLRARSSHKEIPGTWGFGLWNDPFGLAIGFGGKPARLPALPNAAWFFFASAENHLALRDDLPGNGAMAAVFSSPRIPAFVLAPTIVTLPLLAWRSSSRWMRRHAAKIILQDAAPLNMDPTSWHAYWLKWQNDEMQFKVDGQLVLQTKIAPKPPLALVLWLDNQFAAWRPDGRVGYGTLATLQDCWVEITDFRSN